MPKRNNESRKATLAVALASGGNVKDWARQNGVPERTAYNWSQSADVVDRVEAIRRGVVDRAVGQLCDHATEAIGAIVELLREAKSESVKLQAARAVLAQLMAVSSYAALKGRMAELEQIVRQGARPSVVGTAPGPDPSDPPDGPMTMTDGPSPEEGPPCRA